MAFIIIVMFVIAAWIVAPWALIVGWLRWIKQGQQKTIFSVLGLTGFALGTASALLVLGSALYAGATGGFKYYDPLLLKIYRWGLLLSLTGAVFSLGGVWRQNALRWLSPILSFCMILIWVGMAISE